MQSDEQLLLSPREALILGIVAEEFAATRRIVALYADRQEPELGDWVHRKHFLEFMRLRCRPFFPGVYSASFKEIQDVPAPPDTDWVTLGTQRYGVARSKPDLLFHGLTDKASKGYAVKVEQVELSHFLIGSVAMSLGDLVQRRAADEYDFPTSVHSWLRAWINVKGRCLLMMSSAYDPSIRDTPAGEFWEFHGADDPAGITSRLSQFAEFNEHREPFDVGRGLGALLAHYAERLDYCCEFPCHEIPCPEPVVHPDARISNTAKVIERLLATDLVTRCPLAKSSLEREANQCYLEAADTPEVSTSHQTIWFVIGILSESLREHDSVVAGYDAERIHQRSEVPVGGTLSEIEAEIHRFGRATLSDIEVSDCGLEHSDVFKLDSNIERMAKLIWPHETKRLESQRNFRLGDFLQEMQNAGGNRLRSTWARKALFLHKTFRNPRVHGIDEFKPTRQDSRTFYQDMLWLMEKCRVLS